MNPEEEHKYIKKFNNSVPDMKKLNNLATSTDLHGQ